VISHRKQLDYFDKQFERAVTDVGIAAYMLHPKFKGSSVMEFTSLPINIKYETVMAYIFS